MVVGEVEADLVHERGTLDQHIIEVLSGGDPEGGVIDIVVGGGRIEIDVGIQDDSVLIVQKK